MRTLRQNALLAASAAALLLRADGGRFTPEAPAEEPPGRPGASAIAADLLVQAAGRECDVDTAWQVLGSSSFKPDWLTAPGLSSGQTPLAAALRFGCGELVALFLLHPAFDSSTLRRERQRRLLADDAFAEARVEVDGVEWAVTVMKQTYTSKVRQGELHHDPYLAIVDEAWFLPKPGEWTPPFNLTKLGIPRPVPEFPSGRLAEFVASSAYVELLRNAAGGEIPVPGAGLDMHILSTLWSLAVAWIQSPELSEERKDLTRRIRSVGWGLFFRGAKDALLVHFLLLDFLATHLVQEELAPPDEEQVGEDAINAYRRMAVSLEAAWDKLGTWLS